MEVAKCDNSRENGDGERDGDGGEVQNVVGFAIGFAKYWKMSDIGGKNCFCYSKQIASSISTALGLIQSHSSDS